MRLRTMKGCVLIFFLVSLSACATTSTRPLAELRINGVQMPNEAQAEVFSLNGHSLTVYWYYVCDQEEILEARGNVEGVVERRPLADFDRPQTFSNNIKMVGIKIFVSNPAFLKFRIVKEVQGPCPSNQVVYQGIRNYFNAVLRGPVEPGKQYKLVARFELLKDDWSVADSDCLGGLVYSLKSSSGHKSPGQ